MKYRLAVSLLQIFHSGIFWTNPCTHADTYAYQWTLQLPNRLSLTDRILLPVSNKNLYIYPSVASSENTSRSTGCVSTKFLAIFSWTHRFWDKFDGPFRTARPGFWQLHVKGTLSIALFQIHIALTNSINDGCP